MSDFGVVILIWLVVVCVAVTINFKVREREAMKSGNPTQTGDMVIDLLVIAFVSFLGIAITYMLVRVAWEFIVGLFQ